MFIKNSCRIDGLTEGLPKYTSFLRNKLYQHDDRRYLLVDRKYAANKAGGRGDNPCGRCPSQDSRFGKKSYFAYHHRYITGSAVKADEEGFLTARTGNRVLYSAPVMISPQDYTHMLLA